MRIFVTLVFFMSVLGCAFQKPVDSELKDFCSSSEKSKTPYCLELIKKTLNSPNKSFDHKVYALDESIKTVLSLYYLYMDQKDLNAIELRNSKLEDLYKIGKELFYKNKRRIFSDEKDIDIFFNFFYGVLFYTHKESPLIELESIFDFMVKNNNEKKKHIEDLYDSYVLLRLFKKAKAFSLKYKSKTLLGYLPPEIVEPKTQDKNPKYYTVKDNGEKLELITADLNREKLIIGVVSPVCGASYRLLAINDSGNEKIAKAFKEYGILLTPQYSLEVKEVLKWNREHPNLPTYIVYKEKDNWPAGIDWSSTTQFFFFKKGKLVYATSVTDPYLLLTFKNDKQMTCEKAFIQMMEKGISLLDL